MKKAIPIIVLLNVLMLLGLVGFLLGTGRLDKQKALTILDMVKHQGTPEKLREQTYEIMEHGPATTSAPASTSGPAGAATEPGGSGLEELKLVWRVNEAERLRLENEARELLHRQELLNDTAATVTRDLKKLEMERKEFETQTKAVASRVRDEAFAKALALYNELKPKQVKEIFLGLPQEGATDLVSEFLLAMESERAGKIIAEFKTAEERTFITAVLEKIRTATPAGVPAASPNAARGVPLAVQARS